MTVNNFIYKLAKYLSWLYFRHWERWELLIIALFSLVLLLLIGRKAERTQPIENGSHRFTLMFSEFMNRDLDVPCDVIIDGFNIEIQQNEETNLSGDKILLIGVLMQHDSGKWIVSDKEEDRHATEIGGCTGIIIVDFEKKIVVWC